MELTENMIEFISGQHYATITFSNINKQGIYEVFSFVEELRINNGEYINRTKQDGGKNNKKDI